MKRNIIVSKIIVNRLKEALEYVRNYMRMMDGHYLERYLETGVDGRVYKNNICEIDCWDTGRELNVYFKDKEHGKMTESDIRGKFFDPAYRIVVRLKSTGRVFKKWFLVQFEYKRDNMSIYRFETFSDEGERMFEVKEGKKEIIKLIKEINKLYKKAENIHHDLYLKDWKRKALDNYNEAFHENNSLPQ